MARQNPVVVGFIINPIAGLGGKVGLHGTDDKNAEIALARGARPLSTERALRAIRSLTSAKESFSFVTVEGEMGGDVLDQEGFNSVKLEFKKNLASGERSSGQDTRNAVQAMLNSGAEIILFAGGDGTARDIYAVIGAHIPMVGIPAGVKMRSGVFAAYPENAAQILLDFAENIGIKREFTEILDANSIEVSESEINSEFFGLAMTINSKAMLQNPKLINPNHDDGVIELASELAQGLQPDTLYLFGPGRTTHLILNEAGFSGSLIGVDALYNGVMVGSDLSEFEILNLLVDYPKSQLFLGVIGGQGFLLGRGNQQLSLAVLELIGEQNICIVSGSQKLSGLFPNRLYVDLNEDSEGTFFTGYRAVHTSPGRKTMCKVVSISNKQKALT